MAKPILVGNWKNYPNSLKEVQNLLGSLSKKTKLYKRMSLFIAPPLVYFEVVSKKARKYAHLASQDIFSSLDGTHTGVVTPDILKSFGVKLSIIGHSERRELGETNEVVAKKVQVALRSGFIPLICVGEKVRDAEGEHFEFLREQIKLSLEGVRRKEDAGKIIIAYEPVWAIGAKAKEAMSPADLPQMTIFIKKVLTDIFGRDAAEKIPILYGGSVDENNAQDLMNTGTIRGFLVGRASLDGKKFSAIAESII
jgi:triosephosphate isomerase (TIM)